MSPSQNELLRLRGYTRVSTSSQDAHLQLYVFANVTSRNTTAIERTGWGSSRARRGRHRGRGASRPAQPVPDRRAERCELAAQVRCAGRVDFRPYRSVDVDGPADAEHSRHTRGVRARTHRRTGQRRSRRRYASSQAGPTCAAAPSRATRSMNPGKRASRSPRRRVLWRCTPTSR